MKFLKDNIILAAVIGAVGAIIAGVAGALITKSSNPPEPIPPTSTSSLAQGEWEITEKLTIQGKNVDIVWKYIPSLKDNTLELTGRKIKVNHADPTPGEKIATSVCNLRLKGSQAEGDCKEFNAKHDVLRTNVKLNFEDNFTSVTGYFEKDGRRGSKLTGTKL